MKRNSIRLIPGALILISGLLAGCQAFDATTYVPGSTLINNVENHGLAVLLDERVQYSVDCPAIIEQSTSDGRLDVTATIRNRENHPIQLSVDCVFKDDQGKPTEGADPAFQNVSLNANERSALHFVSQNGQSRHFTIRIVPAR